MKRIVACVPDLMDRSKVAAVAPDTIFCRTTGELAVAATREGAALAIVDLAQEGALEAIGSLGEAGVATIGFGSHVKASLLDAARQAGCERVLPRSAFFRDLGALLGSP